MLLLQVDPYFNDNRMSKARFASEMARKFSIAGLILGLFQLAVIIFIAIGLGIGLGVGLSEPYYDDYNQIQYALQ